MNQKDHPSRGRQCCNLDFLEVSLGRNRRTAMRLVEVFVENYPALMERLQESLSAADGLLLGRVLHDIRGNCVLFSAEECLAQTIRLEGMLRMSASEASSGNVDWLAEGAMLKAALERLDGELNRYLARAGA